ncbi:MAG TPA: ATP-binding protein [Acidobacteriota bacterium]|nr:ATP-binding protein [Acidobacteriota bacterium]
MRLKGKFVGYLVAIHVVFAVFALVALRQHRLWMLAVEAFLVLSFFGAHRLYRNMFRPLDLLVAGAQLIKDSDFTTTFRHTGQLELDALIDIYNRMAVSLREERIRFQEQNLFLDRLLDASPSGVITFDYDGRIDSVNPVAAQLLQATPDELSGRTLGELPVPLAAGLGAIPVGGSEVITWQGRRRLKCSHSEFHYRGFPRSFVVIEELTEELRRSEKAAYEKLIRVMSHEVNNSIGAANSLLHSCLSYTGQVRAEDRQDFKDALGVAITRMEHLNEFMRRFADVVRLPSPRLQRCDLRRMLENISLLLKTECDRRRIRWLWETDGVPAFINADPNLMEQAFVNILKNAVEAIGQDGSITIRIMTRGRKPVLIIEDTGRGISPEVKDRLFTPFFSTKEHGQGIGLTMVQEILSRHRFDFRLESEPGNPTRFTISVV